LLDGAVASSRLLSQQDSTKFVRAPVESAGAKTWEWGDLHIEWHRLPWERGLDLSGRREGGLRLDSVPRRSRRQGLRARRACDLRSASLLDDCAAACRRSLGNPPEQIRMEYVMSAKSNVQQLDRGGGLHLRRAAIDRLLEQGTHCMSEVELLDLVLRPDSNARPYEMAAEWIKRFGSLRGLICSSSSSALDAGLSRQRYATLQAAIELARRHYQELMVAGSVLACPRATREFLRMRLRDLPHEVFAIVYLDNRNRVIGFEELFRGTIDGASVHPREVVKQALLRNAAGVILAHNHPSGVAEPSQADELITRRLKEALSFVDIRVLDHLIVGDGVCESFAERGLL
jgi:DNA repair protein RadC